MLGGYMGKFLRIDLTKKEITLKKFDEKILKKYIGGSGLGVKILYDETDENTDPLGPENVLMFMTGPLTNTSIPNSGRHSVIAKSPLSNIFGEASVGGTWGAALKKSGYDGVIVTGKSPKPVYIWINEGEVEIRDAAHLWGKDTYELDGLIKEETDKTASVASIGQAGERLVRIACIMTDGKAGRAAARCGLGSVMGSKNLKAIAVKGSQKPQYVNQTKSMKLAREIAKRMKDSAILKVVGQDGTAGALLLLHDTGDTPVKNWQLGGWPEGAKKLAGQEITRTMKTREYACSHCAIRCGQEVKFSRGPFAPVEGAGPEYESIGTLGLNCLVDNLEAVVKANELCNRYGLDTIETGNAIAFGMEAYERGLITKEDTGIELTWGNPYALVEMVNQIGTRTGIGEVLGQGLKRAAEHIGGEASEFAIHVKGLAFPAHDPRAHFALAVEYATSPIGAAHVQSASHDWEGPGLGGIYTPEIGYTKPLPRFDVEGKGILNSRLYPLFAMYNSLVLCTFPLFAGVSFTHLAKWLSYTTGWDISVDEFLQTGKRIFTLKRLYGVRCGISRKDDILPPRILTLAAKDGPRKGKIPPLNLMLSEFYEYEGWDEFGIPLPRIIAALDLEEEAKKIEYYNR